MPYAYGGTICEEKCRVKERWNVHLCSIRCWREEDRM